MLESLYEHYIIGVFSVMKKNQSKKHIIFFLCFGFCQLKKDFIMKYLKPVESHFVLDIKQQNNILSVNHLRCIKLNNDDQLI